MFGRGGFGEFFVWRDAVDGRVEANHEYKEATDELWRLLSSAGTSTRYRSILSTHSSPAILVESTCQLSP